MKRGSIPLWLLRDLPALVGIALSFWPLMIMVISDGRRAMRGLKMKPGVYQRLMHMLPVAEAMLRFALNRQAYRALGWDPRAILIEHLDPATSWSDFGQRFEAYRVSMMDLHATITFFANEHRLRIRTRVDANIVHTQSGGCPLRRASRATSPSLRLEEENHRALSSSGDSRGRWRATSSSRDGGGSRRLTFAAQPRAPPTISIRYSRLLTRPESASFRDRSRMPSRSGSHGLARHAPPPQTTNRNPGRTNPPGLLQA